MTNSLEEALKRKRQNMAKKKGLYPPQLGPLGEPLPESDDE